jgi:hypothetical protein
MTTTNLNDVWYLTVETTVNGERRGYSLQTRARPSRETVPPTVNKRCTAFLADVVASSDLCDYSSVLAGDRCDWPYRGASYVLTCNGAEVVRSFAVRPIKPCVDVAS